MCNATADSAKLHCRSWLKGVWNNMNQKKKILIIDDDESFVESSADLLNAFDYEVFTAHDGSSGLARALEVRPDLIILDVMMATDTEGFDVARKIPCSPELKHTKVLLVTGVASAFSVSDDLKPDSQWLPVDRVIDKPITPERLLAEIERALDAGKHQ